jgi:hypothetical protein
MAYSVDLIDSIASSGTANHVISIPQGTQEVLINVSALYAAVAATSGISVTLDTSVDGSTYVAAATPGVTVAPAATVLGNGTILVKLGDSPHCIESHRHFDTVKVLLTNLDATNGATVVVSHDLASYKAAM